LQNTTNGSWWIVQVLATKATRLAIANTTNGSWWIVQVFSTQSTEQPAARRERS
jgi:hypothetical protein